MPPYDPAMQDLQQQQMMQDQLRQRMQRFGGVNPMNFNPQAQGAMGFAPSMPQEQSFGGGGNQINLQPMDINGPQWNADTPEWMRNAEPPPESVAPQLPQHMQMQRNRQMQQRAMANRNNMMQQRPPQAGVPGMGAAPSMEGYKGGGAPADFMGMRNAADAARGAMTPGKPMGRVAAGLGAAGSAMGQANQLRNKQKMAAKKPAAKVSGGQLTQPPTF